MSCGVAKVTLFISCNKDSGCGDQGRKLQVTAGKKGWQNFVIMVMSVSWFVGYLGCCCMLIECE